MKNRLNQNCEPQGIVIANFPVSQKEDGKIQLIFFAKNSINPNKDTSFSMTNGNNNLLLKYNSISGKFFASGKNVQARIDFS